MTFLVCVCSTIALFMLTPLPPLSVSLSLSLSVSLSLSLSLSLSVSLSGPACVYKEDDGCAGGSSVRDLANTSLRRKLFGQPSRDGELDEDLEDEVSEQRESKPHHPMATTPLRFESPLHMSGN